MIYECLDYVKEELDNGFPYNVIEVDNAEADDVIGTLSKKAEKEGYQTAPKIQLGSKQNSRAPQTQRLHH